MARVRGKSGVSLTAKSCDPVAVYLIGIVESLKKDYTKVKGNWRKQEREDNFGLSPGTHLQEGSLDFSDVTSPNTVIPSVEAPSSIPLSCESTPMSRLTLAN